MHPRASRILTYSGAILLTVACSKLVFNRAKISDSWNTGSDNHPSYFQKFGGLDYNFSSLKQRLSGEIDRQPWSDPYWSHAEGGITVRWRVEDNDSRRFGYISPYSPEQIDAMALENPEQLNELSPAEKYDIITGGYRNGWPMWRREAEVTSRGPIIFDQTNPLVPIRTAPGGIGENDWQGKCHAWTPAALLFAEPGTAEVSATTANGTPFNLHFGSSDLKALLITGFDMYLNQYPDYARVGQRCGSDEVNLGQGSSTACLDTNAGTFFVLTTNLIQRGKPGFIIDVVPTSQVWNQPVWKYEHEITENHCDIAIENPAAPNGRVAQVKTNLYWISEKDAAETPHGANNKVKVTEYSYCVEIDENDMVVGGEWLTDERPDFIWMIGKPDLNSKVSDTYTGGRFDFAPLMAAYETSMGGTPVPTPKPTATPEPTPAPTPTPVPTPVPPTKRHLPGQWVGFCGHTSSSSECNEAKMAPALRAGECAPGFEYAHIAARWQGVADNSGSNNRWTGTCMRKADEVLELTDEMGANPEKFAEANNFYGICVSSHNSKTCNKLVRFPMLENKSCPAGFAFKEVSARWAGSTVDPDQFRVSTCVALATGEAAEEAPAQTFTGLCIYNYDTQQVGGACQHDRTGNAVKRGVCVSGQQYIAIAARNNGRNEHWVGACLKQ